MAFTSRAPRKVDHSVRATPATVGPGAYDVDRSRVRGTPAGRSAAPFGTTAPRAANMIPKGDDPGPGAYDVARSARAIETGGPRRRRARRAPFGSRSSRFGRDHERRLRQMAAPGPDSYDVRGKMRTGSATLRVEQARVRRRRPPPPGRLSYFTPPTIPPPQARGYEEDAQGRLVPVRNPEDDVDPSVRLGPGTYTPSDRALLRNKPTVSFARQSGRERLGSATRVTPRMLVEGTPGPGAYDTDRSERMLRMGGRPRLTLVPNAPFGSTGPQRSGLGANAAAVPGPGAYDYAYGITARRSFNVTYDDVE